MSADSPRRTTGSASRGMVAVPSIVPPQVVSDRSILDSAIGFINEVTLAHQPHTDPKDTITWARFETAADISDPRFGEDWELEGNVAPPLLLILGYGLGVQVWAIPANGEAVEVLSWRHGIVSALRVLPTPFSAVAIEENGRADEPVDVYAEKRPLIALVDGSSSSGSQPQFCAVNFISLKTGTQVKTIKFKNPVIDVLANRSSIVITFHERIAVFDARTLEDRLSITTCYPSPGINPNPVALGHRWLAYAEHKLIHSKRSGGGCDGEGVASYTATVLNASKSLVKGLRELGEQVAAGLTGTSGSGGSSKNTSFDSGTGPESKQSGVVTIIDIKNPLREFSPTSGVPMSCASSAGNDPIVAHFIAHSEALVAMEFDNSGMLLLTADRRGHDFHVFRIQPNPVGPSLAAVHHLYVLHRGDTSAKVQNISFSLDSRWVAVSTLRGTTHVFPITPYGGPMGVRTHTSLHVVNKLSRFHRSAGLSAEGRSNSPISHSESTTFSLSLQPYHNPTLPPYPRPTVVMPLAQLRQPFVLGSPPGSATLAGGKTGPAGQGSGSQRQRLSSLSDDSGKPLSVCAIFAKSRSWLLDPPNVTREAPHRMQRKAVDSLFVMAGHGALIQYDLDTKLASNVAKEKICDDTPIDLEVEAKAQWNLGRRKEGSQEIMPPLTLDNWLVKSRNSCMLTDSTRQYDDSDDRGESWLAQVEIVTHAGPHRRLWMGPQFVFKTYNTPSGSNLSHVDIEAVEIGTNSKASTSTAKPDHSSPLNMPLTAAGRSSAVPVLIESGSYSSIEQSPKLMDRFRHDHLDSDFAVAHGDTRLKEDLADAMRESPSASGASKDSGGGRGCVTTAATATAAATTGCSNDNVAFYDALADHDEDQDLQDPPEFVHNRNASAAALASALPNIYSYDNASSYESIDSLKKPKASIEKIVNPLGTVTTVTSCLTAEVKTDILDEVVSQLAAEDTVIHENCDESLFRPVVAIFCDEKTRLLQQEEDRKSLELCQPPENIGNKLVVPVIEKEVDDELNKKEKQKQNSSKYQRARQSKERDAGDCKVTEKSKFEELSPLNKKSNSESDTPKAAEKIPKPSETTTEQSQETKYSNREKKEDIKEITSGKNLALAQDTKLETVQVRENDMKMQSTSKAASKDDAKTSARNKSLTREEPHESNTKSTSLVAKNKNKSSSDIEKSETKSISKQPLRGSVTAAPPAIKNKKGPKSKESTPEREQSPKPVLKKPVKISKVEDSEEEKPVEFMRMTPAKEEKPTPSKPLTKKELKKQQQQKALEDGNKQKDIVKTKEVVKDQQITDRNEEMEQPSMSEDMTHTKVNRKESNKQNIPTEKEGKEEHKLGSNSKTDNAQGSKISVQDATKSGDNKAACKLSTKEEQKSLTQKPTDTKSETPAVKESMDDQEPLQTAVNIKISAIDKTATKREETKTTDNALRSNKLEQAQSNKAEVNKPAKLEATKSVIKTEELNVKDLADSLIEIQDEKEEEGAKNQIKSDSQAITPPLETVDIFTAPTTKLSKKSRKKSNKSGSSSETEEVVEVDKTGIVPATKVKDNLQPSKKKSSDSSEESFSDLADRLLERKEDSLKETMFISFQQIEENKKSQGDKTENQGIKSKETEKVCNQECGKTQEADVASHKNKERKESVKDMSEAKSNLNVENKSDLKTTEKTLEKEECPMKCAPKDVKERNDSVKEDKFQSKAGTLQEAQSTSTVEKQSVAKEKCKEKQEKLSEPSKPKHEVLKKSTAKEPIIKMKEEKASAVPPKSSEGVKKCEKLPDNTGSTKRSEEKYQVKDESTSASCKSYSSDGCDKDKSVSSNKTAKKINNMDENDKKKSEPATETEKKKHNEQNEGEIKEKKLEKTAEKSQNQKVSEKKSDGTQTTGDKKDSQASKGSETHVKSVETVKELKQTDLINKTTKEDPSASKSAVTKLDVAKDQTSKMTAKEKEAPAKSPGKATPSDPTKKSDSKKPQDAGKTTTMKDKDVVVEQPRKQQNREQEKEEVINRYEKDFKTTLTKEKDVEKDVLDSKSKVLPVTSPKKEPNKANKNDNETALKKSAENMASKESKEEPQKSLKKSAEMDLPVSGEGKTPASASTSKPEARNAIEEDSYKIKVIETPSTPESLKTSKDSATKPITAVALAISAPPVASAWKTLSGAEMISKNFNKTNNPSSDALYPSLGATAKIPKANEKLLPELPTPKEMKKSLGVTKTSPTLDDFPSLQALEPLPPLPTLEPLELLGESRNTSTNKDISLINFESPLQETPAMERKITPPPRGFTEQNLIFALCGSLHYENEQQPTHTIADKSDASSSNRSSSAMDEPSMADYKSLTENDDPYISLEQSSQDTNTTNTHTTNDKFSSSNNSSGTEEIIIMEEKKMTKKQKRKRQQQLLELQKQKELQLQQHQQQQQQQHHHHHLHHLHHHHHADLDDEELRPLIAMSESQIDTITERVLANPTLPSLLDDSFSAKPLIGKSSTLTHSTTTDSEGPMPATTSDDNVFIMPSSSAHTQHKIKTKKLEHKFNLIAAIEAATSSSTSSAEESGVEVGGGSARSRDNDDTSPMSASSMILAVAGMTGGSASGTSAGGLPIPMSPTVVGASPAATAAGLGTTVGGLKKKTKRRKR